MSLTQSEFLTIVDQTSPDTINIWYSDTEPLTVFGLTIPVLDLTNTNVTELLQAIQGVNMTINGYNYTFQIETRSQRTALSITYYFFDVVDQQVNSLADDTPILVNQVIFVIPGLQDINFLGGDYDALINNVDANRTSTDIMVSDRYKVAGGIGSTNPLNIDALRTLTAERASVQDSNYSISGWINSRYDGTQTDRTTYGGVDSALTGKFFEGSLFPLSVDTPSIQRQITSSQVIYDQYLYTGNDDLPTVPELVDTGMIGDQATLSAVATQITVQYDFQGVGINVGDIIKIQSITTNTEYMRVTAIQPVGVSFILTVDRGWNNTQRYIDPSFQNQPIYKLGAKGPTKIYKSQGNKVQGVQAGKLVVRDSGEILTLDVLGQVMRPLP